MIKNLLASTIFIFSLTASADDTLPMPHPDEGKNFVCYSKGVLGHEYYSGSADKKYFAEQQALESCFLVRHRCHVIKCVLAQ